MYVHTGEMPITISKKACPGQHRYEVDWLDEFNHVKLLRSILGSRAAKKPAINLAAKSYGFGNVNDWLKLASQFEDVGMSAYVGAAPLISRSSILATAASITARRDNTKGRCVRPV
jgi:hypothetical protein